MNDTTNFTITNTTNGRLPRLPFLDIKNKILGKKYDLSLVFIGDRRSQTLNKQHRKKDKPANILTFSLSKHDGEIFINIRQVQREAKSSKLKHHLAFIFIHGLLHLKGLRHGSIMEREEERYLREFKFK